MKLCLVSSDKTVETAIRMSCPPHLHLTHFSPEALVDSQHRLTDDGRRCLESASSSEALLITWSAHQAAALGHLCRHVHRQLSVPTIALCLGGPQEELAALEAGVDETMTYVHLPLVRAKARAVHRIRTTPHVPVATLEAEMAPALPAFLQDTYPLAMPAESSHDVRQFGIVKLNRTQRQLFIRNQPVELTAREYELLDYLMAHANTALTRDQILNGVWGIDFDTGTNMVDVYMHFLRRKLKENGAGDMIQTVRRYGYRLAVPE